MFFFRPERGIGRGEVAESRVEAPMFAAFMLIASAGLFAQHLLFGNVSVTTALTISLFVFGVTVVRVEFGLYILTIAMLLSPEIDATGDHSREVRLNLRYDDILIIVIFVGVMVKLAFEGRMTLWRPSQINYGIVVYYSVCIASSLLALKHALPAWDRRTAFFVLLKMLQYYLVFWLVGHAIRTREDVRKLLVLFFTVTMAVALYAITTIGTMPRVSAPFEQGGTEPNTLGGYLVVCICAALGMFTQAKKQWVRLMLLAIVAISMLPLLYTLSRASYMALVAGVFVLGLVSRKWYLLLLLLAGLAVSPFVVPDEVRERVLYTFDPGHGQQVEIGGQELPITVDKSTHERIYVWQKVSYILSIGWIFTLFGGGIAWGGVLDSQYARVLIETGVLGCAAFIFLQFTILRTTRQAYRWTEDWMGRGLSMGLFAATIALNVHSIGTISFLIVRIMQPFWLLLALSVYVRNQALEDHWQRAKAEAHRRAHPEASVKPAAAAPRPLIRPAVSGRRPGMG